MFSILLAVAVFAFDLWTKWLVLTRMTEFQEIPLIRGFFTLQFVYNPGAAFGMLANQQWLFVLVSLGAIVAMISFLRRAEAKHGIVRVAIGLLLGGAAGNLVDRIRFGKVVDFLLFYHKDYRFPNFNVADMAITAGVGLFIFYLAFIGETQSSEKV